MFSLKLVIFLIFFFIILSAKKFDNVSAVFPDFEIIKKRVLLVFFFLKDKIFSELISSKK